VGKRGGAGLGTLAQQRHHADHFVRLADGGRPQVEQPFLVLRHLLQQLGVGEQALHARRPARIGHPAGGIDDLSGIARGVEHVAQDGVRVQGDRGKHRLELGRRERVDLLGLGRLQQSQERTDDE
jgi:hypothetical protein